VVWWLWFGLVCLLWWWWWRFCVATLNPQDAAEQREQREQRANNSTRTVATAALPLLLWWILGVAFGRIHEGWRWVVKPGGEMW